LITRKDSLALLLHIINALNDVHKHNHLPCFVIAFGQISEMLHSSERDFSDTLLKIKAHIYPYGLYVCYNCIMKQMIGTIRPAQGVWNEGHCFLVNDGRRLCRDRLCDGPDDGTSV